VLLVVAAVGIGFGFGARNFPRAREAAAPSSTGPVVASQPVQSMPPEAPVAPLVVPLSATPEPLEAASPPPSVPPLHPPVRTAPPPPSSPVIPGEGGGPPVWYKAVDPPPR
jgi:hypothetical protein